MLGAESKDSQEAKAQGPDFFPAEAPEKSDSAGELIDWEEVVRVGDRSHSEVLSEQEKNVFDLLSESPVQFDFLCERSGINAGALSSALIMLELGGLAVRISGDRYVRKTADRCGKQIAVTASDSRWAATASAKVTTMVSAATKFIRITFHGISRKYLQMYLAAYWCQFDRNRWHNGSVLEACLQFGQITGDKILSYVSPSDIKLVSIE